MGSISWTTHLGGDILTRMPHSLTPPFTTPGPVLPAGSAVTWLGELAPTMRGRQLIPASSGGQFSRAARAVNADAAQWAVEVGHDVADRVAAELPGHTSDGGFDVLRMGTESTTLQLLIWLRGVEISSAATSESLNGLPDFARRGVSLDELLRGIQLGHSVIAAAFLAECARHGDAGARNEQMRTLSQRMFLFFDSFSTAMATAYRAEQQGWARSDAGNRLAVTQSLLAGREESVDTASRRLRYDLARTHVAVIMWSSARTLDTDQQALHDAACDLVRRAGCDQKLVLDVRLGVSWAWMTPQGGHRGIGARLSAASLPSHVHAAFGETGRGIEGFRASHTDAAAAFALQSALPSPEPLTAYRDVDLITLLLADRERAARFAHAELGPLAADDPHTDDLRRTLAVYLDEGGSPQAAATRLHVSRNTVTYRVRRAEEILGQPSGARRQQLQAALAVLAQLRMERR